MHEVSEIPVWMQGVECTVLCKAHLTSVYCDDWHFSNQSAELVEWHKMIRVYINIYADQPWGKVA